MTLQPIGFWFLLVSVAEGFMVWVLWHWWRESHHQRKSGSNQGGVFLFRTCVTSNPDFARRYLAGAASGVSVSSSVSSTSMAEPGMKS